MTILSLYLHGVFAFNLFPQSDEAVEAIKSQHPADAGWEVRESPVSDGREGGDGDGAV